MMPMPNRRPAAAAPPAPAHAPTPEQIELAVYAAAHRIYRIEPNKQLACASSVRSRFVDAIADEIRATVTGLLTVNTDQ